MYAIPKHDELYEKAKRCKLCVVIHASYPGKGAKHVDLSVNFGFDASQHSTEDCLIISPFTSELGKSMIITPAEKRKLIEYKAPAISMRFILSEVVFEQIASDYDNKWGVSYLLKQYFNARVREGQKVNSASVFYRDFINYFETKFRDEIAKKAQDKTKAMWKKKMYDGLEFIEK